MHAACLFGEFATHLRVADDNRLSKHTRIYVVADALQVSLHRTVYVEF